MKKARITFESIVSLRKFEASLSFLGITYTINEEAFEIEIESTDIAKRPDLEIKVTSGFCSIGFKSSAQ